MLYVSGMGCQLVEWRLTKHDSYLPTVPECPGQSRFAEPFPSPGRKLLFTQNVPEGSLVTSHPLLLAG